MERPKTDAGKVHLIEIHFKEIMKILGVEEDECTEGTPLRVAKMLVNEVCRNADTKTLVQLKTRMKCFPNETQPHGNVVMVRKIAFTSWCSHHFLPFGGYMNIGYVPDALLLGLSKFPRVVKHFSKKPQMQEYLVADVCDFIYDTVRAGYVVVSAVATHACVACRGVENPCEAVTYFERRRGETSYLGTFRDMGGFSFG